jgi:hypothetical protein
MVQESDYVCYIYFLTPTIYYRLHSQHYKIHNCETYVVHQSVLNYDL